MTDAAFLLGHRAYDSSDGVFIAPPGVDAATAEVDDLLLHIGKTVAQLVLRGYSSSFPDVVALGFTSFTPIILVTSYIAAVARSHSFSGDAIAAGLVRPSGNYWRNVAATALATPSSMTINASGSYVSVGYLVFNRGA